MFFQRPVQGFSAFHLVLCRSTRPHRFCSTCQTLCTSLVSLHSHRTGLMLSENTGLTAHIDCMLQRRCPTLLEFGIYGNLVRIISPVQIQKIPNYYLKFTMKDGKKTKQSNQNHPNKHTENPTHQPKLELFRGTQEKWQPSLQPTFGLESETRSNSQVQP